MKKLIIANWKMNPGTATEAEKLIYEVLDNLPSALNITLAFAPPYVFLDEVGHIINGQKSKFPYIALGAQDASFGNQGPETGEVSPSMLRDAGVEYAIIGHSERRALLNESDELIAKKINTSLEVGLKVILCVGEPMVIRTQGLEAAQKYIQKQLEKDLASIKDQSVILAYEPIWAISTSGAGLVDTPEDAEKMITFIKSWAEGKSYKLEAVLYGGSVRSDNAKAFLSKQNIDGCLVGGASLNPKEFKKIIDACS